MYGKGEHIIPKDEGTDEHLSSRCVTREELKDVVDTLSKSVTQMIDLNDEGSGR